MTWRGRLAIGVLVIAVIAAAAVWWLLRGEPEPAQESAAAAVAPDTAARAPDGVRIRVRVLNGTKTTGLARRGMQRLRDYGYDVVDFGTASASSEHTFIEVDASARAAGDRIARALGGGDVRERRAPSPHVDVTVVLGADWQPPPQPFRP